MIKFYKLVNSSQPHCQKCGRNYPRTTRQLSCSEFYGKGKERNVCRGQILKDTYLDWSINLLKDYSLQERSDLSLYDEVFKVINSKLEQVKTGATRETGQSKVDIQSEIEQYMRTQNINVLSWTVLKMQPDGHVRSEMVTKSFYKVPEGESIISQFGYEDLAERFEAKARMPEGDIEGYMKFTPIEEEEKESSKVEVIKVVNPLECEYCGFVAKSKLGLAAHQRACKKKKESEKKQG